MAAGRPAGIAIIALFDKCSACGRIADHCGEGLEQTHQAVLARHFAQIAESGLRDMMEGPLSGPHLKPTRSNFLFQRPDRHNR